jgi:hypothetical protein
MRKNTPDNFWSKVRIGEPRECWEWQGSRINGYGKLSWHGQRVQAHRVAYYLANGEIELLTGFRRLEGKLASYKMFVLHKCDNRPCCNPSHLFLGSLRTNMLDAYIKGRKVQPRSKHVNAKLTPDQVREIRCRYDAGEATQMPLAKEYGVSQRAISLIVRRETYRDVQ